MQGLGFESRTSQKKKMCSRHKYKFFKKKITIFLSRSWLEFTFFKVNKLVSGVRTPTPAYNNTCPCQLSYAHEDNHNYFNETILKQKIK